MIEGMEVEPKMLWKHRFQQGQPFLRMTCEYALAFVVHKIMVWLELELYVPYRLE